jgi:hypothetical protein
MPQAVDVSPEQVMDRFVRPQDLLVGKGSGKKLLARAHFGELLHCLKQRRSAGVR